MLSEEIKYQLDFIKKSKIISIQGNVNQDNFNVSLEKLKSTLRNTSSDKISIVNYHECFTREDYIKKLIDVIESYKDKEFYISATTSSRFPYFFHPLVNLVFWKGTMMRQNISWFSDDKPIKLFDESLYQNFEKSNKGILSVRKETNLRNYLFSVIDSESFNGVIRYGKWAKWGGGETNFYRDTIKSFPNFIELIDEYKSSYISFIVETELSDFMNPLTEKTFVSMLTKTMPVILGGRGFVKEIKDMGIYIFNEDFGFTEDDDNLQSFDVNKADSFYECIKKYNQMTVEDIKNMYNSNIDKIENNYNIVSELLFDKKEII